MDEIAREAVNRLRDTLGGELLLADDEGYESVRPIWNAMHDQRPAVIVRPRTAEDVVAALTVARTHRMPIAVRG
ncbi:MAG: FAD-linked oxidase, partial [Candidatus Limnocylindria bacterium]